MYIPCPKQLCMINTLVCVYRCKPYTKRRCPEYTKHFAEIVEMTIETKYVEKYGEPEFPEPYALVRKRREALAKKKAAEAKPKPKRKKRVKKCPSNLKSSQSPKSKPKKQRKTKKPVKSTSK